MSNQEHKISFNRIIKIYLQFKLYIMIKALLKGQHLEKGNEFED